LISSRKIIYKKLTFYVKQLGVVVTVN